MDQIRAQSIDGGKLEASQIISKSYEGSEGLPVGMLNRLRLRLEQMGNNALFNEFNERFHQPLAELVAMVWRIKEIEQAELGSLADDLFRESVSNVQLSISKQVEMKQVLAKKFHVSLHSSSLAELRAAALTAAARLHNSLINWQKSYHSIAEDEELMTGLLAQDYPLYWDAAISLHQVIDELLETAGSLLRSLRFSLRMIGAPVKVNQETVAKLSVSLLRAGRVLKLLCSMSQGGNQRGGHRDKLMEVLDRAYVYPNYHNKLDVALKKTELLWGHAGVSGTGGFVDNVLLLKQNYLEQDYRQAERLRAIQEIEGPLEVARSTEIYQDCRVDITIEPLNTVIPRRILSLVRLALDSGLLDEAESLMRVYLLTSNSVVMEESHKLDVHHRDWRDAEEKINREIKRSRRGVFRLVGNGK